MLRKIKALWNKKKIKELYDCYRSFNGCYCGHIHTGIFGRLCDSLECDCLDRKLIHNIRYIELMKKLI